MIFGRSRMLLYSIWNSRNGRMFGSFSIDVCPCVSRLKLCARRDFSTRNWRDLVTCWTLVISIPILLLLAVPFIDFDNFAKLDAYAWEQFLFLSFVNSLIGFFLWFKGMAMAGVRAASQIQLLQPFLTDVVGVTFSNETPSYIAAIFSILILVIIVFS